jgi:hypothetical protein
MAMLATPCAGDAFDDAMVFDNEFDSSPTDADAGRMGRKACSSYRIRPTEMCQGTLCST